MLKFYRNNNNNNDNDNDNDGWMDGWRDLLAIFCDLIHLKKINKNKKKVENS